MKFRGTFALFLILLVLGGWVYLTDVRDRDERDAAEAAARLILGGNASDIVGLRIVHPDRTVAAERIDDGWRFVSPEDYEADSDAWDTVAGNVGRIDRDETVVTAPADLEQYGLDPPVLRLGVDWADGRSEELLFGDTNPQRTFNYARLASDDDVFLISASWRSLFTKQADDLRDRTILRFDQDATESILVTGDSELSLRREGTGWRLDAPVRAAADPSRVSTFLGGIDFARAEGFAATDQTDAELGLDPPRWTIRLSGPGLDHELRIGRTDGDQTAYFARDASRSPRFRIDSQLADLLSAPLLAWRDKSIASFEREGVSAIRIVSDDPEIDPEIDVRLENAGPDWVFADDRGRVDPGAVSAMLSALEFGVATGIIDDPGPLSAYGLDSPRLRIVLEGLSAAGPETPILDAVFGSDATDSDHIYFKRADQPAVWVVSKDVFDPFLAGRDDLQAIRDPE
jgi:hypothetical protein